MKKTLSLLTLVLILTTILSACGKKSESPSDQYGLSTKNNIVWHQLSDIQTVILYLAHDANAGDVYQVIWEPLNSTDSRTQVAIP